MTPTVHIIASCADRKRGGFGPAVRLRSFRDREPAERLDRWWSALLSDGQRVAASELYVGPYWSTVRDLTDSRASEKHSINLWVASAGYGLLSGDTRIRPYSATFAPNASDSVVRSSDARSGFQAKDWWKALSRRPAPQGRTPRTATKIAQNSPRSRILVIGSPAYVAAMEDDLRGALATLGTSERLLILTGSPGPRNEALRECWLESSARLLSRVGGSLPALHARVARRILDDAPRFGLDTTVLRERWEAIAERSPAAMKPERIVSTDDEVKQFIRSALLKDPGARHTRLLRELRAAGRACEQSRFRNLYRQVAEVRSK